MDEVSDNFELTPDKTEKLLQFQDLTGIEDLDRCKQILHRFSWDFETAVRLTLEQSDSQEIREEIEDQSNGNHSTLRHRPVAGTSSQNNSSVDTTVDNQIINNNVEYRRAETRLTIWSFTTRLISFPFAFIYDTLLSLIRFALSLIRTDPIRSQPIHWFFELFRLKITWI